MQQFWNTEGISYVKEKVISEAVKSSCKGLGSKNIQKGFEHKADQ